MHIEGFEPDGRPTTIQAAKLLINEIRFSRGHIGDDDQQELAKNSEEWREKFYRNSQRSRDVLSKFTSVIADQIYTSRFQFIYELLQNADDAVYAENVEPCITFRITPGHLVAETNEIGFTSANVQAICDTGESSKAGDVGTTGEKGLGFKSVFGVANYVHIQSGLWSFRFEHDQEDTGIGMVTPIWTNPSYDLPVDVGTSFRLQYITPTNVFLDQLVVEFERISSTVLFALRKLRKVVIHLQNVSGRSDSIFFERDGNLSSSEMTIHTTVDGIFGQHKTSQLRMRLFQSELTDMPAHRLRTSARSSISLAFPLDLAGDPDIDDSGQHVFAFLPVQRVTEFTFLIHGDFILSAGRQTILDNDWNRALKVGISALLCTALVSFSEDKQDKLSTRWMRYLPKSGSQGFWEDFWSLIACSMVDYPVVLSMQDTLRKVSDVRLIPSWFTHNALPLLPDTKDDVYLSQCYAQGDLKLLERLGLQSLTRAEALQRLRLAVSVDAPRLLHDKPLDDNWHDSITFCLIEMMRSPDIKEEVLKLEVIPLSNGSWTAPVTLKDNPIYLPLLIDDSGVQIEVPERLGLRKLHLKAYESKERITFYTQQLAIGICEHEIIIQKIFEVHAGKSAPRSLADWRNDFMVLFWYKIPKDQLSTETESKLKAVSRSNKVRRCSSLLLPSDRRYDAELLLKDASDKDFEKFDFLNKRYLDAQVRDVIRSTDWITWLQELGMSSVLPLTTTQDGVISLSSAAIFVATKNAIEFVPMLQAHWATYKSEIDFVIREISDIQVPCIDKTMRSLGSTFVMTPMISQRISQLGLTSFLPVLDLPSKEPIDISDRWKFLEVFGVVCEVNLMFYLAILRSLKADDIASSRGDALFQEIYDGILEHSKLGEADSLKEIFEQEALIYTGTKDCTEWSKPSQCVWSGPDFLATVKVLSGRYRSDSSASQLFQAFLNLRDVTCDDIIDHLHSMSIGPNLTQAQSALMPKIYSALAELTEQANAFDMIRGVLDEQSLVFAGGQWHKLSECIWSCAVEISGRVALEPIYADLHDFFVESMKVTTISADLLAQELVDSSKQRPPHKDHISDVMMDLGRLLSSDSERALSDKLLKALKSARFMPVQGPAELTHERIKAEFYINDHPRYAKAFEGKINLAAFDYEQLSCLQPLFRLFGLQNRYLTHQVRTETIIEDRVRNQFLTQHLRERAEALSCCAIQYGSSEYYGRSVKAHELLLQSEVFLCKEMGTDLLIQHQKSEVRVRSHKTIFKLDKSAQGLKLFLPSDEDGIQSCFCTGLPPALATFLGVPTEATKAIYRILNDASRDLIGIMKDEDIISVSWIKNPYPQQLRQRTFFTRDQRSLLNNETRPEDGRRSEWDSQSIGSAPSSTGSGWKRARDQQYQSLLKKVVRQARHPHNHDLRSSASQSSDILDDDDSLVKVAAFADHYRRALQNGSNFHESARIGAAGELYVFERLKALGLPNFTIANWQSEIRHVARAHPDYRNIPFWTSTPGVMSSDIVYKGDSDSLRTFLRQHTSHPYPAWIQNSTVPARDITYHFEVKTTTGMCNKPFFLSRTQYQRIRDDVNDQDASTIAGPVRLHVLVRVYNLFSSNIGMQLYINPWHLRGRILQFIADPWKVVPSEPF